MIKKTKKLTEAEAIRRITYIRKCLLEDSCLYYKFDYSLTSDATFDIMCRQLVEFQEEYWEEAEKCPYHEYFKDFDGSTGFDLPIHLPEVVERALELLKSQGIIFKNS